MTRTITTDVQNALAAENVPIMVFVELDFASGAVRVTNAGYSFDWNGNTWVGLGNLGSIEPIHEGAELQMYGIALRLSGIPPEMISIALGEHYQGRSAKVWFATLDHEHQVIADPILIFSGRMDTMNIDLGETAEITLTAESRLSDWERPRVRRYNNEDQLSEYPTDKGFEFVPQMVNKTLIWGRA